MRLQVLSPGFHVPGGAFVDAPHLLTPAEEESVRAADNAETLLARTMRVSDEAAGNIEHAGPPKKLPAHDGGDHGHDVAAQPPQAAAAAEPPAKDGPQAGSTAGTRPAGDTTHSGDTPGTTAPTTTLEHGNAGGSGAAKSL